MDGATPVKYGLLLCNDACVKLLKSELEKLSGISAEKLVIAELFGALIMVMFVFFDNRTSITKITNQIFLMSVSKATES